MRIILIQIINLDKRDKFLILFQKKKWLTNLKYNKLLKKNEKLIYLIKDYLNKILYFYMLFYINIIYKLYINIYI